MSLQGKVALVTGSTSGIGLGIARALAAEGADIMLNGFGDPAAIERCAPGWRPSTACACCMTAPTSARPTRSPPWSPRTEAELGRLDILVNNAGIQHVAPIADFPPERWDAIIAINLSSAFHAMQAAIPGMKARGWGRIINIASAHGLVGSAEKSAYVAAKHGIVGLTKVAAHRTGQRRHHLQRDLPRLGADPAGAEAARRPGRARRPQVAEVTHTFLTDKQPMAQFSTPEGIGALAVFLCSDAAATMTGCPYSIDGGWTAQ